MEIFGVQIPFTNIKNVSKSLPEQGNLLRKIETPQTQIYRTRQEIADFKY